MDSGSNECRSLQEEGQGARPWRITAPREQAGNLEPHEKKEKDEKKKRQTQFKDNCDKATQERNF